MSVAVLAAACTAGSPEVSTQPANTSEASPPTATATSSVAETSAPTATTDPVPVVAPLVRFDVEGDAFYTGDGVEFVPVGVNYFNIVPVGSGFEDRFFSPAVFDESQVNDDFALLSSYGYNVVRLFMDSCGSGPDCAGASAGGGLNPEHLAVIARVTHLARQNGLYLLLTSNDLPDQGGYWEASNRGASASFAGYRNAHYLTEPGVSTAERYWTDLMGGLVEHGAAFDAVFAWSILNEQFFFEAEPPFTLTEGDLTTANGETYEVAEPGQLRRMASDGTAHYIARVAAVIRSHDPGGLVTMGFFHPSFPNPVNTGDRLVDTVPLLAESDLDFFDFHGYPGGELSMAETAENFGMVGYETKPIVMGEFGAFIDRYPDPVQAAWSLQRWQQESCALGIDGWLHWGFLRAPLAIGDATWGFVDDDGRLLDALSPVRRSACDPPDVELSNLAIGRPVTASRSLADQQPFLAVDGGPGQWGSGADAPQWIEVDFEEGITLSRVRLTVEQFPSGPTRHEVLVRFVDGSSLVVHAFEGDTAGGDLLEYSLEDPIGGVVALRITTTSSPSWVAWQEIEVYAP